MHFTDRILVELATESTRQALFDDVALEQIISAGFDNSGATFESPFSAVFERLDLGFSPRGTVKATGSWMEAGTAARTETQFELHGIPAEAGPRIDALWRGGIVARTSTSSSRVIRFDAQWPDLATIDEEIGADLGTLPADPANLEQERRTRLLARVRAGMAQPDAFSEAILDRWLQREGVSSVGELIEYVHANHHATTVQIELSEPEPTVVSPRLLPIRAALLIRDVRFSVAQTLADSAAIRERLRLLGLERPAESDLRRLRDLLVVWIVPDTVFEDADWPGATPAARRAEAGVWLAREGIGLAAVATT